MSEVVAKGGLTAYQRWELPTFDIAQEVLAPAVVLPTAAEVEHIRQQAHEEGYAEGCQKARSEEQLARDEAQRLAGIIGALDKELQQVDQQVAQSLLDLSMEISRQMLQQALKVKPELLLGTITKAIAELPHLILHPSDAELVRNKMGEQLDHTGWKIIENAQMERGGCRVETAHSQIDASLATRWKRIVSSIGQDNSWLEP